MLADDLCLFGDNAYLNSSFMATPYVNTSSGDRDAYNFYFSQLRIRIECAFGMFVHRWALLRSPMPATQPISRKMLAWCYRWHAYTTSVLITESQTWFPD